MNTSPSAPTGEKPIRPHADSPRSYDMPITEPGYIGGHFWWYYVEDMLPTPSTMYATLSSAIQ